MNLCVLTLVVMTAGFARADVDKQNSKQAAASKGSIDAGFEVAAVKESTTDETVFASGGMIASGSNGKTGSKGSIVAGGQVIAVKESTTDEAVIARAGMTASGSTGNDKKHNNEKLAKEAKAKFFHHPTAKVKQARMLRQAKNAAASKGSIAEGFEVLAVKESTTDEVVIARGGMTASGSTGKTGSKGSIAKGVEVIDVKESTVDEAVMARGGMAASGSNGNGKKLNSNKLFKEAEAKFSHGPATAKGKQSMLRETTNLLKNFTKINATKTKAALKAAELAAGKAKN